MLDSAIDQFLVLCNRHLFSVLSVQCGIGFFGVFVTLRKAASRRYFTIMGRGVVSEGGSPGEFYGYLKIGKVILALLGLLAVFFGLLEALGR
jgi:hypothetical protein